MDILFGIVLIVIAVIAFVLWMFARVVGFIFRAIFGPARPPQTTSGLPAEVVPCRHARCRAANPAYARFCRRCGRAVGGAARDARSARMRYVA